MTWQEIHQSILVFELETLKNTGWDLETIENQDHDLLCEILISKEKDNQTTVDEFIANGGVAGLLR